MITGKVSPWTGRFYSLLDPSYAKNHIPIIASVSEHQPTSWSSFYFDLQVMKIFCLGAIYRIMESFFIDVKKDFFWPLLFFIVK